MFIVWMYAWINADFCMKLISYKFSDSSVFVSYVIASIMPTFYGKPRLSETASALKLSETAAM